jgi:DHA1 family bicyclomycin/chloramphenicol resistance-like MFS transporter
VDTRARHFRWRFAALLAALSTLGPFSIDAYLPAFAGIQQSLEASPLEIQQTMSGYLFAFGVMFLFHGALSDSFGRRPVILVALIVYTLASVGAALATTVHGLVLWRVVQGLSVGAGMVVGRAMIRDLFNTVEAQRLMSLVTLFFGLAPAIAPIIGGWLFIGLGWRSIFWFLAAVGFILVAVSFRALPETLADDARQSFHPRALWHGYQEVGIDRRFLLLSLTAGFNFNAFFLYIVSAPAYLGEHLKLGPQQYAWLFIPSIAGIMIGARISGLAAGKVAPVEMVKRAYVFMATAAFGNLAYAFPRDAGDPVGHGADLRVRHRVRDGDAVHHAHHARPLPDAARHGGLAPGFRERDGEHGERGTHLACRFRKHVAPRRGNDRDDADGLRLLERLPPASADQRCARQ